MLAVVHASVLVHEQTDVGELLTLELSLENCLARGQKHLVVSVDEVVGEASDVNLAVAKDHGAMLSQVVVPGASEGRAVTPNHRSLAFSFAVDKVTLVYCDFIFVATIHVKCFHGVFVKHSAFSVGSSIFEEACELVSVRVTDAAEPVQSAFVESSGFYVSVFKGMLLTLEDVALFVLNLAAAIGFVVEELTQIP